MRRDSRQEPRVRRSAQHDLADRALRHADFSREFGLVHRPEAQGLGQPGRCNTHMKAHTDKGIPGRMESGIDSLILWEYPSLMPTPPASITPAEAFALAVDRIAGGQSAIGKLCEKTQGAVSKRLAAKREIWAEGVLAVEAATGISRHDLRPDLYPREDSPAQPPAGAPSPPAGGSSSALEGVRA